MLYCLIKYSCTPSRDYLVSVQSKAIKRPIWQSVIMARINGRDYFFISKANSFSDRLLLTGNLPSLSLVNVYIFAGFFFNINPTRANFYSASQHFWLSLMSSIRANFYYLNCCKMGYIVVPSSKR